MTAQRRADRSSLFANVAVALACVAALAMIAAVIAGSPGSGSGPESDAPSASPVDLDDGAIADPDVDLATLMPLAATAMAGVTSVEFRLQRAGAPVFIDQFEEIALDSLRGQFTVPTKARAELTVTIDEDLTTKIGAVAIDSEVWISNPVTGDFETLPAGYDIDPSRFFDPTGGWQPLIANLADVELIDIANRGGDRYHVRGTAGADDVRNITVGLVRDQDVAVDFWIHPKTALVTAAEFTTVIDGGEAHWILELENFGSEFTIDPPENVRG
jgi:LppX_LprAFG lipoprotein